MRGNFSKVADSDWLLGSLLRHTGDRSGVRLPAIAARLQEKSSCRILSFRSIDTAAELSSPLHPEIGSLPVLYLTLGPPAPNEASRARTRTI